MNRIASATLASLLTVAASIGAIESGPAAAQEADPESGGPYQNYITWNMCQSVCHDSDADRRSVTNKLATLVTGSTIKPRAIATQEMCREEFDELHRLIDSYGYDSIFYRAKNTGECTSAEGGVGNALFWREFCTTGCRVQEAFDSAIQAPGDGSENRGYACGRTYEWDAWYCSVHITSKTDVYQGVNRYYQREQIATMRIQSAEWRQNGRSTVMMGDFNVRPDQAGVTIGMFYDLHVEAEACFSSLTCMPTHEVLAGNFEPFDRKLDYLFASDTTSPDTDCDRQGADPKVVRYASLSDHTFVRGYIICPSD